MLILVYLQDVLESGPYKGQYKILFPWFYVEMIKKNSENLKLLLNFTNNNHIVNC